MAGSSSVAYVAAIFAALMWGLLGLATRNLDAEGFTALEVTFLRMAICAAVLFVLLLAFDRDSLRIKKKDILFFVALGLIKVLVDLLLYIAQVRIDLALATVLEFTSPYFVLIFSVFLFGDKITLRKLLAIFIGFIGCILVTGVVEHNVFLDVIGCLIALMSGVSYAAYTVGTKLFLNRGYSENGTLFYIFLFGMILMVPFNNPADMVSKINGVEPVLNLLFIGVLLTLVPYYLIAFALKRGNAVTVNLLGLLEVVAAAIVGYFMFDETLTVINMVGVVLVPLSIAFLTLDGNGKTKACPDHIEK